MDVSLDDLPELKRLTSNKNLYKCNDTIIVQIPNEFAPGKFHFALTSLENSKKNEGATNWPSNELNQRLSHHYENEMLTVLNSNQLDRPAFPVQYRPSEEFQKYNQVSALLPTPPLKRSSEHLNQNQSFDYRRNSANFNRDQRRGTNYRRNGQQHRNRSKFRGRVHGTNRRPPLRHEAPSLRHEIQPLQHEIQPFRHEPPLPVRHELPHELYDYNAGHVAGPSGYQQEMYSRDSYRGRPSNYNSQEGNSFPKTNRYFRGSCYGSNQRVRNWKN